MQAKTVMTAALAVLICGLVVYIYIHKGEATVMQPGNAGAILGLAIVVSMIVVVVMEARNK